MLRGLAHTRQCGAGWAYASRHLHASSDLHIVVGVVDVFDALAAPARRAILDVLSKRSDQTLFEVCGRLAAQHDIELTRQAISQHLAVLEEVGLVRSRRDGRYKFHAIDTTPLQAAVNRWLDPEEMQE
jgi:DNA-binding transcriptional ArsR family regulator